MGSKRKKSYYSNTGGGSGKRYKGAELQHGAVGFLFSFAKDRERQAKAEAYELLNSYAEGLPAETGEDRQSSSSEEESEDDIEAAMQKQLTELKQKKVQDKFTYLVTGVNQMMFMKTCIKNHHSLIYKILDDAKQGELKCQSRALNRILPVLASCRAELDKIGDCALAAIKVYLTTDNLSLPSDITYKFLVKVRNNNDKQLSRIPIISCIGESMRDVYSHWSVSLSDPYLYIVVDILKTVCCVSVIHGYSLYRKFNLHELVAEHRTEQAIASGEGRVKVPKDESGEVEPTGADSTAVAATGESSTNLQPEVVKEEGDANPIVKKSPSTTADDEDLTNQPRLL